MVLSVTICLNILGISPSPLLFYSPSSPHLFFLPLPLSPLVLSSPLRPVKSVISPIVIGWFFVFWPTVGGCSQPPVLTPVSALFVHVCCHVDVSVLRVVLTCEQHTCSLVSFV